MSKTDILVVEDDAVIAMDIENQLTRLGYNVTAMVGFGDGVIERIHANRPDVVLMDIVLRGEMDGIDVAQVVRTQFDIPVVFLTGYADKTRLERAKLAYPFGYILKPFQPKDLEVAIEMALHIKRVDAKRKQAETALRESEAKFRSVFEDSLTGMILADKEGKYIQTNQALSKVLGYSEKELLGMKTEDVTYPGDIDQRSDRVRKLWTGEIDGFSVEKRYVHKDGHVVWSETTVSPVRDAEGNTICVVGQLHDTTERKRAERRLKESEELHRITMENILDPVFMTDDDGKFTFICDNVPHILGYSTGDLEAMGNISKLAGDTFFDPEALKAQGEIRNIERIIFHRTGREIVYLITVKKVDIKGGTILYTFRDITERKLAEERLSHESAMRDILLDNLPCIALILKKGTREIVASNKVARQIGADPGKTCYETCSQRDDKCPWCLAPELWATGEPQRTEIEYRGAHYEGIWVPFSEELYVHYIFDITERKKVEDELRKKKQELKNQTIKLEKTNTALTVLLDHRTEEKKQVEKRILSKLKALVFPYMEYMKNSQNMGDMKTYLDIARSNLNEVVSNLAHTKFTEYLNLTPVEVLVSDLIKEGKTSKEIASMLSVSPKAIFFHRNNIRKKLGISNKKVNLRSYLQSLR